MKLLWVKSDFLHPTTRGGQIRTLEMLRRIHTRHEVYYTAFDNPHDPEGLARSNEYCSHPYPIAHRVPDRNSPAFAGQAIAALVSPLPLAVSRYRSALMARQIQTLIDRHRFDSMVCDFLFPAPNIARMENAVLFQHNVESTIWARHVEHATGLLHKAYFRLQARRMYTYEASVCRRSGHVVAVSSIDADRMKKDYGVARISHIETGVNMEYFAPSVPSTPGADLVFVGSMDWLPNIDGVAWFHTEILPRIRREIPDCSVDIVGRKPESSVLALAAQDSRVRVTGTVEDVRPYLWGAKVSVIPLRIGGGTRLKIYEAIAAGLPVVSTRVGTEGLPLKDGTHILVADKPEQFAASCVELLRNENRRRRLAATARDYVAERFGWDTIARSFEAILEAGPRP